MLSEVTPSVFCTLLDRTSSTLQYAHVLADGALAVVSGLPFGSPSSGAPLRLTAIRASDGARTHFLCTAVISNVLTVTATDGLSDIALAIGDLIAVYASAETFNDIETAVLALQTVVNEHATNAAPLVSPVFTGIPEAPTATPGTNTIQIATTAFVLANQSASAVSSVAGRTGAVVLAVGDVSGALGTSGNGSSLTGLLGSQISGNIAGNAAGLTSSISTSQVTGLTAALALLAPLANPTLTGTITLDALAGILKGSTGVVSAATAGADYVAPGTATSFSKQQNFGTFALTDAATIAWDVSVAQAAKVTLGGNRTLGAPTNLVDGGTYLLRVIQGTGGQTLAYNAVFKWPGGVAPTLSTGAGAIDFLTFASDGTHLYGVAQLGFA
jgi:hypothetical protein